MPFINIFFNLWPPVATFTATTAAADVVTYSCRGW